jgi:EmrB/QacA subfamily drug resistance transporter
MVGPHRLPCETPHAEGARKEAHPSPWVLPATILGSSLGFIDSSVLNVALPAIQSGLAAELASMQWVMNGYMLTLASLILLGGAAGDRLGRRRVFLIGLAGFAITSIACGLAPSAAWLIAGRLAQGATAALLVPASLAIIGAAYSGEARGQAIGTWAAAGALTTALGPVLGGWLVDTIGWRSIFFINLPLAAAAVGLALKLPADSATDPDKPLDLRGAVLAVLGLGLLSYGLIALGSGRTLAGTVALIAALPVIWLFVKTEARSEVPMMPLTLFRNGTFAGANTLTVLLYAALTGALFLLPFLLIHAHGYSAAAAGAAFLPFSIIMGLGSRWAGGLAERMSARLPLVIGCALTASGFVVLAASSETPSYWGSILPGLVIVAVGMTLCVAPLTTTVFSSAPSDRSGAASGINNAAARAGGLLAVAALGLAFGGADASSMKPAALTDAYRLTMFAAAILAALSALTAAMTIRPEHHPQGS